MKIEKRLEELGIEFATPCDTSCEITLLQFKREILSLHLDTVLARAKVRSIKANSAQMLPLKKDMNLPVQVAIGLISTLKHALGDLDRIKRVVKVVGFVNSSADFTDQPAVVNGASDFFVEVFGDKGKHARSAVGMVQLPGGIPVEVEMVVEIED